MPFNPTPPKFGTQTKNIDADFQKQKIEAQKKRVNQDKIRCIQQGGTWDEVTKTCNLPFFEGQKDPYKIDVPKELKNKTPPKVDPLTPEFSPIEDNKGKGTLNLPGGRTFVGIEKGDAQGLIENRQQKEASLQGVPKAGTAQAQANQQFQAQQLAGQLGNFQQLGVSPTGLDTGEAFTTGLVGAIPRALSFAATGAALGAAGGTAVLPGVGTAGGAAIGAIGGFVSGLASSMISNYKSQRSDTTTAQQRVLDEGKQNLNDWATLAAADPANRALYVKNFNQQLALIDQAYRQMKLDTNRDIAKFETALPNLAEFESFYNAQGERDYLTARMNQALLTPVDTEGIYQMQELATRRSDGNK